MDSEQMDAKQISDWLYLQVLGGKREGKAALDYIATLERERDAARHPHINQECKVMMKHDPASDLGCVGCRARWALQRARLATDRFAPRGRGQEKSNENR